MDGHRRNRMKTLRWTNAHTGGSDEGGETDEWAQTRSDEYERWMNVHGECG
jgi:hypothetical protein